MAGGPSRIETRVIITGDPDCRPDERRHMSKLDLHPRLALLLEQRCFFMFLSLLALLITMPFLADTASGRVAIGLLNLAILLTAVVAVGRSRFAFMFAAILGLPTVGFQLLALDSGETRHFALYWGFGAAFYAFTIGHLLHYVLRREHMTADKLYGAVAAYIMIAIWWAFMSGVLQHFYPGAYAFHGQIRRLDFSELIFFSFTVLTTTGFGDITPVLIQSRFLTILEAVTGIMYVAILIARLTGVYPVIRAKP
jgi:hypothetical protein